MPRKTLPLSDICSRITSGGTPSRSHPEYYSSGADGHVWIKSKELLDCSLAGSEERISDLGLQKSSAKYVEAGSVLVGMYGANVGQLGWLKSPATVNQAVCSLTPNPQVANHRWLFYALLKGREELVSLAHGAAQQNISQEIIKKFEIEVPDLQEQQKVVVILSAYDDLIENNRRRIEILEEIARRLYEEWFVQFHFPGHEEVGFKESELGLIPESWELLRLGDCVELAYGKALKAQDRVPGDYPVYGSSGVVGTHCKSLVEGPGIVVGRKGNVGSVFWSDVSFFPIDTTYYVRSEVPFSYVYFNLQRQRFLNNDAAVPGLNREQAYALPFLLPDQDVLSRFSSEWEAIYGLLRRLERSNVNLRAQRDLLLPKLISGKIDVSDIPMPT